MKKILFALLALLLFAIPCNSQLYPVSDTTVEVLPLPDGGTDAFIAWIDANNRLVSTCPINWSPAEANGKKIEFPLTLPISFIDKPSGIKNK